VLERLSAEDPPSVGPYRLEGRLGSGGMGQVFLGRAPDGKLAAVKVIHAELADSPSFRARFERELAAAQKVGGRFTAPVVDADMDGPQSWLATAYVDGPSLAHAVAADGPLPTGSVLALAAGLAEGLAAIHAAGVVHRDLKPSNVLLAGDGPRIIDFGISHAAEASTLTRTGMVIGSPGFMSPEQAEGREVGPASDIFSLGAVLVFAATGEGPFGAGPNAALIYRIVHGQPRIERAPAEIRPLVERCLAKNPQDRPEAGQIQAELAATHPLDTAPGAASGPPTHTAVPMHRPPRTAGTVRPTDQSPRRRSRLAWAAGGLVTAFVIGIGGLAIWQAHSPHRHGPQRTSTPNTSSLHAATPAATVGTLTGRKLPAPVLLSPVNGTLFSYYQREVTLRWQPVPDAASYFVQITYCLPGGCGQTGRNIINSSTVTVTITHYKVLYGSPARWRVTAIGPGGKRGRPSPWWSFG